MNKLMELSLKINNNDYIMAIRDGLFKVMPIIILNALFSFFVNLLQNGGLTVESSNVLVALMKLNTSLKIAVPYFFIFLFSKSIYYIKYDENNTEISFFAVIALLLFYVMIENENIHSTGTVGFSTLVIGYLNYKSYVFIKGLIPKLLSERMNNLVESSFILDYLLVGVFHFLILTMTMFIFIYSHREFSMDLTSKMKFGNSLKAPLEYNLMLLLPWLFGINGSHLVNSSYLKLYSNTRQNIEAFTTGIGSFNVIDESFYHLYVNIGGSGSTLCLLIAVLFCNGNKTRNREFAKLSTIPAIFNLNEIVIFGLPIIGNVYLIIPFILVPMLFTVLTFLALQIELIPTAINYTSWVTPVFINGILSSNGNVRVFLWQLFLVVIGSYIYFIFIRKYELESSNSLQVDGDYDFRDEFSPRFNLGTAHFNHIVDVYEARKKMNNLIKKGNFILYFQPIVDIDNNKILKLETLVRIEHSELGIVPPFFLDYMKKLNKIKEMDYWIIDEAFKCGEELTEQKRPFDLSINVSAETFLDETFYLKVVKLINKYSIRPENFTLELVEEICLNDLGHVKEKIRNLQNYGFKVAIDDFGTGYSSLSYLLDLEADYIKIDRKFVENLKYEKGKKIMKKIIDLCKSLDCKVIVEGVETKEELEIVRGFGASFIQGYYFFRPSDIKKTLNAISEKI